MRDLRPCYFCKRKLDTDKALQCMGPGNFAHYICFSRHDAPRTVEFLEAVQRGDINDFGIKMPYPTPRKLSRRQQTRLRRARKLMAENHTSVSEGKE